MSKNLKLFMAMAVINFATAGHGLPLMESRRERRFMKTKFGAIIVAGSGSAGGHTFSKNRTGSYMRTKVTPINPQSATQTNTRNRLSSLATGWKTLTEAQRAAWNGAVGMYKGTNIFGDVVKPSGYNLYIKLNTNIIFAGGAALVTPLAPIALPSITSAVLTCTVAGAVVSLAYAPTPVPANISMIVDMTPPMSPGKYFVKNEYRNLAVVAPAAATPYVGTAAYALKFGAPLIAGQKVNCRLSYISKTTGQAGLPVVCIAIIT